MVLRALLAAVLAALFAVSAARIMSRCELANELLKHNISTGLVKHWICLADAESLLNTDRVGQNADLTSSYGIFQIHQYWCGKEAAGGDCNVECTDLINEDINDDIECALKIYQRRRFSAWNGWRQSCRGVHLEDVSTC